ncbi:MAG: hypothetical protein ACD_80C00010G0003 [uncultured bacterium (gcode 4)]|uniref:Uncharacterized protein n=1 Tax=uncultured bacterium (gcode 4) TaxID=1234023 RepID=K1YK37_9BACT|nr:MAG: hypothetical protein ACD_80C00010G0003 [uncultured bacterium (gcode 4)]
MLLLFPGKNNWHVKTYNKPVSRLVFFINPYRVKPYRVSKAEKTALITSEAKWNGGPFCLEFFAYFLGQCQKVCLRRKKMPSRQGDEKGKKESVSSEAFNLEKNKDYLIIFLVLTNRNKELDQSDSHILQKHLTISGQTPERFFQ